MKKIEDFEKIIGYEFKNKKFITEALTHSSYANENRLEKYKNNERLEFLGDAVLEVVVSEKLFLTNEKMPEGELTKLRASIVCEKSLAFCARKINLGEFLLLGKGEDVSGGRNRDSVISDAFEAVIGAMYLDGGIEIARNFILENVTKQAEENTVFQDSKTKLQEIIQLESGKELTYILKETTGPDHNKIFKIDAVVEGKVLGQGVGHSKKEAEQKAAFNAINNIKTRVR